MNLEEINDAVQKYIIPNKLVIVAAGSVDEKGEPLEK